MLEEQRRALRGAQHQEGVDCGNVNTFVEQIYREHGPHHADPQIPQRLLPFGAGAVAPYRHGGDPMPGEMGGHESGVLDADTESQAAHRGGVNVFTQLVDDESGPSV